jgi:DNA adenine methylase
MDRYVKEKIILGSSSEFWTMVCKDSNISEKCITNPKKMIEINDLELCGTLKKNRPLIRWAGSKTRILHLLAAHSPASFGRYIEPFCGSLSLFLRLKPGSAVVGDINGELINFYEQVKASPAEICVGVHNMPRTKEEYYRVRALDCDALTELERSIRFFFLNRHCFNGVYRTNKLGGFNVPFGSKLSEIPSEAEIMDFSARVQNTIFRVGDFEHTVLSSREDDFIYLDPPYAGTESKDRGEYGPGSFKEFDIGRLGRVLREASARGSKILLSYADTDAIKLEFSEWNIEQISVERSVSGFAKGRKKVSEVLIMNY